MHALTIVAKQRLHRQGFSGQLHYQMRAAAAPSPQSELHP